MKFYHPIKGPEGGCGLAMFLIVVVAGLIAYVYGKYFI